MLLKVSSWWSRGFGDERWVADVETFSEGTGKTSGSSKHGVGGVIGCEGGIRGSRSIRRGLWSQTTVSGRGINQGNNVSGTFLSIMWL
ncbi:hypothetical protein DPEC_G00247690 [Dallia pectoralis]|uniref:Uncharacterized protein n=1 Tax=Dallia pectoralis TaxID=75939 RepID=A0ACC2FWL1_DALPE|nr:hypothetical protein DPEC_G00247690 [Dallia pectoralis]